MNLSILKPYHGYQSSFIPFTSNYYLYLASWDKNPTRFANFSNIWLITPEDKRILFSDPSTSSDIVCIYHIFHEIHGASITLDWISENRLHVQCTSIDHQYKLSIDFLLHEPLTARLLLLSASGPPTRFRVSSPMVAVSNFLLNLLVAKGGSVLAGNTETGQPFYHGEAERLFQITEASLSVNGKDLGRVSRPTWPVRFGDSVPFVKPVIKLGTLYIPYEEDLSNSMV